MLGKEFDLLVIELWVDLNEAWLVLFGLWFWPELVLIDDSLVVRTFKFYFLLDVCHLLSLTFIVSCGSLLF